MKDFEQVSELILGKLKKELPANLSYHNIDHTIDVLQAAAYIANLEGVAGDSKRLLLTAALFHDTGFFKMRDGHEAASCIIARNYLPAYNYRPTEIDEICDMIMATKLPQSPHNHLEEILCDADLDYLGRDDFFTLSNRLFTELHAECIVKNEDEWNREQADFMEGHQYHTTTSVQLRQPKKEAYIELIKSKI